MTTPHGVALAWVIKSTDSRTDVPAGYDIVGDQHTARQRRADLYATFAMW